MVREYATCGNQLFNGIIKIKTLLISDVFNIFSIFHFKNNYFIKITNVNSLQLKCKKL